MKVIINPKYSFLENFIYSVFDRTYSVEETYRDKRNKVEDTTIDGVRLVIKFFKKPTEFNRVVYTWFRPTKAKRSYENSMKLLEMGYIVPEPIAYLEKKKGLFFHTGCYISLYTDCRSVRDFCSITPNSYQEYEKIKKFINNIASFSAKLHNDGILHNDYNIDNILYKEGENGYEFILLDLNRLKFNNKSKMKSAKDISNMHFNHFVLISIIDEYCRLRKLDPLEMIVKVVKRRADYSKKERLKNLIFSPLGLRKEA